MKKYMTTLALVLMAISAQQVSAMKFLKKAKQAVTQAVPSVQKAVEKAIDQGSEINRILHDKPARPAASASTSSTSSAAAPVSAAPAPAPEAPVVMPTPPAMTSVVKLDGSGAIGLLSASTLSAVMFVIDDATKATATEQLEEFFRSIAAPLPERVLIGIDALLESEFTPDTLPAFLAALMKQYDGKFKQVVLYFTQDTKHEPIYEALTEMFNSHND